MDSNVSHPPDSPKPKKLKTLICSLEFPGGNSILHRFVLDHSRLNPSASASCIRAALLSMSDVPVNALNGDGFTALHLAVSKNNLTMVQKLLSCFVDIDAKARCRWGAKDTALHLAARLGHLSIIQELLDEGVEVDIRNGFGETALCLVAASGNLERVKWLIDKGADMNAKCALHRTPLHYALAYENSEIAAFLIGQGADVDARGDHGRTPFHAAVIEDNFGILKLLTAKGADVHAVDRWGETALYLALCFGRDPEIVTFLIGQGPDLDAVAKQGETLLHAAAVGSHLEGVKFLIDKGADVNARNNKGETPLHSAVCKGNYRDHPYRYDIVWDDPFCPILDCVTFLLDRGADVHAADADGWTPLHVAADVGHESVIRVLLDKGADINATNEDGKTPLDVAEMAARETGNESCIQALKRATAACTASVDRGSAPPLSRIGKKPGFTQWTRAILGFFRKTHPKLGFLGLKKMHLKLGCFSG